MPPSGAFLLSSSIAGRMQFLVLFTLMLVQVWIQLSSLERSTITGAFGSKWHQQKRYQCLCLGYFSCFDRFYFPLASFSSSSLLSSRHPVADKFDKVLFPVRALRLAGRSLSRCARCNVPLVLPDTLSMQVSKRPPEVWCTQWVLQDSTGDAVRRHTKSTLTGLQPLQWDVHDDVTAPGAELCTPALSVIWEASDVEKSLWWCCRYRSVFVSGSPQNCSLFKFRGSWHWGHKKLAIALHQSGAILFQPMSNEREERLTLCSSPHWSNSSVTGWEFPWKQPSIVKNVNF